MSVLNEDQIEHTPTNVSILNICYTDLSKLFELISSFSTIGPKYDMHLDIWPSTFCNRPYLHMGLIRKTII